MRGRSRLRAIPAVVVAVVAFGFVGRSLRPGGVLCGTELAHVVGMVHSFDRLSVEVDPPLVSSRVDVFWNATSDAGEPTRVQVVKGGAVVSPLPRVYGENDVEIQYEGHPVATIRQFKTAWWHYHAYRVGVQSVAGHPAARLTATGVDAMDERRSEQPDRSSPGARKLSTPEENANETFNVAFRRLPWLGATPVAPAEWRTIQGRGALSLRLGAGYRTRNKYCWAKNENQWPGPGWIDVCIDRQDPALFESVFELQPAVTGDAGVSPSDDPEMTDLIVYDSWHAEAGFLGGRRAIVERGRATGGMAGFKRQRKIAVLLEMQPGLLVRVSGSSGDDAGYGELLAIAATVDLSSSQEPPK